MKERPILFSGPMVRAILAGTKTQTRRPVASLLGFGQITEFQASDTPSYAWTFRNRRMLWNDLRHTELMAACPYGQPGDRLWVRETFMPFPPNEVGSKLWGIVYGADAEQVEREAPETYRPMLYNYERWSPSIHMPRWACRLVLEIVSVRVERVQEVSEADALAEGVSLAWYSREHDIDGFYESYREAFQDAWNPIYAAKGQGWDANPWVWVVEFKRVEASA